MLLTIVLSLVVFAFCLMHQLYKGVENARNNLISLIALLLSGVIIIGCSVGINLKINKTLPTDEQVGTGVVEDIDLALQSNSPMSKKIARFSLENDNADFINLTEDKDHNIYLLEVVCNNKASHTFILNILEMYELLPYLTFDYTQNVE